MTNEIRATAAAHEHGNHSAASAPPTGGSETVPIELERAAVVRRLLARGLTPGALRSLLPGWDQLIVEASGADGPAEDAAPPA